MYEHKEETYLQFRKRIRGTASETNLIETLRMHQTVYASNLLGIAKEMLEVVKKELAGPAGVDMDIEVVEDEDKHIKLVAIDLPPDARFVVLMLRDTALEKHTMCTIKYGDKSALKDSPQGFFEGESCRILAQRKLEEMIIDFLKWYTIEYFPCEE